MVQFLTGYLDIIGPVIIGKALWNQVFLCVSIVSIGRTSREERGALWDQVVESCRTEYYQNEVFVTRLGILKVGINTFRFQGWGYWRGNYGTGCKYSFMLMTVFLLKQDYTGLQEVLKHLIDKLLHRDRRFSRLLSIKQSYIG